MVFGGLGIDEGCGVSRRLAVPGVCFPCMSIPTSPHPPAIAFLILDPHTILDSESFADYVFA